MRGIEPHGNQQGLDFTLEITAHPAALLGVALAMRQDAETLALQGRQQIVVVQSILTGHHGIGVFRDGRQTALCVRPGAQALQSTHDMGLSPHFKKFVQIGRHDAQIAQALEQGHIRAVRPIEHPLVESQNAQIAIQQR